jgi:hypothetical protein
VCVCVCVCVCARARCIDTCRCLSLNLCACLCVCGERDRVKTGALSMGLQTAMESGLSDFSYDAVVRYCQLHDLDYDMNTGFESSTVEITASTTTPTGLRRAFELAHLIMTKLALKEVALERNKRVLKTNYEADLKSLESRTSRAMLNLLLCPAAKLSPDTRFLGVTPESADELSLQDLRAALDGTWLLRLLLLLVRVLLLILILILVPL